MSVIFCDPRLTMKNTGAAKIFFDECNKILRSYINVEYAETNIRINQLLIGETDKDDMFIFFIAEDNSIYDKKFLKLIQKFNNTKSRIWPIAMEKKHRCPPDIISEKQSFDVSCRNENRSPYKNNMKAIAQIFARKIISQTLSPLYQDEVLYFISHRRSDGEVLAARLADELKLLTRERNIYRDAVNVEVGDEAQKDIDEHLKISDVLIFLQTEDAQKSEYIMKELCYAIVNDIPVLWIQIDDASKSGLKIKPGDGPVLSYKSENFYSEKELIKIAEEIEEKCFQLIMNSSNQVYSYVECLEDMRGLKKITLERDKNSTLAYALTYEDPNDSYGFKKKHYIQCFGRNPKEKDFKQFIDRTKETNKYAENHQLFLLSNHGNPNDTKYDEKVFSENFDNYLINIENVLGRSQSKLNKRIIISGAFPDSDEIYKVSLIEALMVYSKEIIRNGYTLVFGAHPTFQNLIFDIGRLYSADVKYSIEMHMSKVYLNPNKKSELKQKCSLVLSDGLQNMREKMICQQRSEVLICLGGKIKEDKSQQGVDIEIELAKKAHIPVVLVGTVGGRSSEYAHEVKLSQEWDKLNTFGRKFNEEMFCNVNHKLMAKRLLNLLNECKDT